MIYAFDQGWSQDGWKLAKFFFVFFFYWDKSHSIKLQKQMTLILPAGVANQNAGFASPCPLTGSSI